jgi:hypothetical protein
VILALELFWKAEVIELSRCHGRYSIPKEAQEGNRYWNSTLSVLSYLLLQSRGRQQDDLCFGRRFHRLPSSPAAGPVPEGVGSRGINMRMYICLLVFFLGSARRCSWRCGLGFRWWCASANKTSAVVLGGVA